MNRENERTISGNQCDDATLDTGEVRAVGAVLVTQPGTNSRVRGGE
jgi:hypothetical protein